MGGKGLKILNKQGPILKFKNQTLSPIRTNTIFLRFQSIPKKERANRCLGSISSSLGCNMASSRSHKDESMLLSLQLLYDVSGFLIVESLEC
ncbi:hypothetical protein R3W88_033461 [Solanum pinnatisectum]|uniref:Uncharacterized protein n=1 Tax=Solanum pinnatisectum TaxID=50273 RepID=A0AAV9K1E0_9SOLN|nr:hypothetical protein R3W88_033461 [Solanum pinnatisectum]